MKLCALCKVKDTTKPNTHYLTDGIIRSALNEDGKSKSSDRERGLYFEFDSEKPYIKPNFQHNISPEKLLEAYAREVTDEEIARADRNIPYSVDNVFCPECEDVFTAIENRFIAEILPKFRKSDLSDKSVVEIKDSRLFRLFFLLQIYRSSICEDIFSLPSKITEELRDIILNNEAKSDDDIKKYSLSVTYLETLADENVVDKEKERQKEYTANKVGYVIGENPYIIMMNDFYIQFYEEDKLNFYSFFGLNDKDSYRNFINKNEDSFKVKIVHDKERRNLHESMIQESGMSANTISTLLEIFIETYIHYFQKMPSPNLIETFNKEFKEKKLTADMYTQEKIELMIHDFMERHL